MKTETKWISKYALTAGVLEKVGSVSDNYPSLFFVSSMEIYHKPHWHDTREEALNKAESMRVKKIASLKKQISDLEKMEFLP